MKVVWKKELVKSTEHAPVNCAQEAINHWLEWTEIHNKIKSHFDQERQNNANSTTFKIANRTSGYSKSRRDIWEIWQILRIR